MRRSAFGVPDDRVSKAFGDVLRLGARAAGAGTRRLAPAAKTLKAMPGGVKQAVGPIAQGLPKSPGAILAASPAMTNAALAVPGVKPTLAVGGGLAGVAALKHNNNQ